MKNLDVYREGFRIGGTSKVRDGYIFIPNVAGRGSSRKAHSTPKEAIPAWAKRGTTIEERPINYPGILRDIAAGRVNRAGDHWGLFWCEYAAAEIERLRTRVRELEGDTQWR